MKKTLFLFLFAHLAFAQSSSLPIILINTNGTGIVDEPKIKATMEIIDNGEGATNKIGDKPAFSGYIGIEYRGSSSQSFPKKPYGLETWTPEGIEVDTSLFGWPSESDWILFASYNEKSLIHNVLSMRIGREMGLYASRTKYVELYLNNNYEGVYVFMEKIKRNKGRVDIAKLNPDEESGDDLTG
ncbi:MAG: CotH kinase family protein, partial [Cytophagales bacterium]|nr:CotH kinase family protein [Cytophagales bacterium]